MKKSLLIMLLISTTLYSGWRSPFKLINFIRLQSNPYYLEPVRTTPIFYEGKIYILSREKLAIFDNNYLKLIRTSDFWSTNPILFNNSIFLISDTGKLYSIINNTLLPISSNGKILTINDQPIGDPILCNGEIFLEGTKGIYNFDPLTLKLRTLLINGMKKLYWGNIKPYCYMNKVFALAPDGILVINSKNFTVTDKIPLDLTTVEITGQKIKDLAFPLIIIKKRIFVSTPSRLRILSLVDRTEVSSQRLEIRSVGYDSSGIIIADNTGQITHINTDGKKNWSITFHFNTLPAPTLSIGSNYYITGDDKFLIIFNRNSKQIWRYYTTSGIAGYPFVKRIGEKWEISFTTREGNFYRITFTPNN